LQDLNRYFIMGNLECATPVISASEQLEMLNELLSCYVLKKGITRKAKADMVCRVGDLQKAIIQMYEAKK